ncbi:MAG TPA: DUF1003 domain-containing protein [Candidatus Saccharimonadales bacterium]|nr:DUF1003 domain-containing protein [Candidatus Saccharimonadales bacterium]
MHIETLEEIKKEFPHLQNSNEIHKSRLSRIDKLGLFVTDHVGTMGFFFIILGWTILWLGWNILAPKALRFDPYPAFVLWLFISNLIQLHLLPLLMVGQNIQARHAEIRSDQDYQTDKKAAKAIEAILLHLEHQQQLLETLVDRVEQLEKKK